MVCLEHIRWHEEQHIGIFSDYVGRLDSLLAGQPCECPPANQPGWRLQRQAAQDAFDAEDASWQPPPYSGPWGVVGTGMPVSAGLGRVQSGDPGKWRT